MMGEVATRKMKESSVMEVSEQEKAIANFKAFYHQINAKPDCKSIVYTKNIRIDKVDITDLSQKIIDKFHNHYENAGYKINVHITFADRKTVEFTTWESFDSFVWPNTELNSITIQWEYFLKLPEYELPQLHRLIVKISDGIRPEEMLNLLISGRLEEIDELEKGVYPLAARVDFVNNVISDELLQIVKNWAEGVKIVDKERRFLLNMRKIRRQIAYFLNYFTTFMALLCGLVYINISLINSPFKITELDSVHIQKTINLLFIFMIIVFVMYKVSQIASNYIFKTLEDLGENHVFQITKNDKKRIEKIQIDEENKKKHIIANLIFSIILNIACGILTGMII